MVVATGPHAALVIPMANGRLRDHLERPQTGYPGGMRSLVVFLSALVLLAIGAVLVAWIVMGGFKGLQEMDEESCAAQRDNDDNFFCYEPESPPIR
jgi:hypothetical protein